ncbi:MAG TPA: DUF2807 domain-containing protein [Rhizomicrobium sp.]|nr:DUF2807 domain-containing protein [Rhizomicrobium sp.]
MRSGIRSMVTGAAVAALLVLPAAAGDSGWVTWPTQSYNANTLRVDDVVGNVRVNVADGPMKVDVSGSKEMVGGLSIKNEGNLLHITGSEMPSFGVWDWKKWFDFSHIHEDHTTGKLFIKVTVPKGTSVRIDDLVGDATIGDTYGPLRLETTAGDATVGKVSEARISTAGSGKTSISEVGGELRLEIAGSGRITAGRAGSVKADIAGSGDAQIGTIGGGASIDIAGSGDFTAAKVSGPVRVSIAGSGNVKIADGLADPLRVDILGAGDLYFGGVAVDPRISAMGSGNVRIRAYRGKLSNDGMANVQIGGMPMPPTAPMPPMPPSHMGHPPMPPAPPAPPGHHGDDDDDGDN